MSQINTPDQSLSNGLPPRTIVTNNVDMAAQVMPILQHSRVFNGIDSSHSSRDSSPSNSSHHHFNKSHIPAAQLPPSRESTKACELESNLAHVKISSNVQENTPNILKNFDFSTPKKNKNYMFNVKKTVSNSATSFNLESPFSPIMTNVPVVSIASSNSQTVFNEVKSTEVANGSNDKSTEAKLQQGGIFASRFKETRTSNFHQPVPYASHKQIAALSRENVCDNQIQKSVSSTSNNQSTVVQANMQQIKVPSNISQRTIQPYLSKYDINMCNNYSDYQLRKDKAANNQQASQMPKNQLNKQSFDSEKRIAESFDLSSNCKPKTGFNQIQIPAVSESSTHMFQQSGTQYLHAINSQQGDLTVSSFKPPLLIQPINMLPKTDQQAVSPLQKNNIMSVNHSYEIHKPSIYTNRYPQQSNPHQINQAQMPYNDETKHFPLYKQNYSQPQPSSVPQSGFNKFWGNETYDLLQYPDVLPPTKILLPKVNLGQDFLDAANCSPDVFCSTITKIPETNTLLQKSRLPLGILIHPFKDLNHLPVIQCNVIVRCRSCRTYINPFVFFIDNKRWKCNLCYRVNELPEEFQYDPVSKTYGDPSRRPEIKSSTIEYIAPAEYMLRPPQPAVYLFLLDISRVAIESGYLQSFCQILASELINLPGDARTQIGFVAYDSALHFYALGEGLSRPHEMIVLDIDDVFLPYPDNLLVNLKDRIELISDLLVQLPVKYENSYDNGSALGAALQAAHKLMGATGGRVTVFQASLPVVGPGALVPREDPNNRASSEAPHLNPANDFYKRLALECSGQQIAVDLFIINSQYVDIATISGISRFSGGCIYHFPLFKASRILQCETLERCFKRYLTRKIGFEAVMRIRCTRGLSIHTFHGNFFVRSTDLLSLPNVNPDAGFGMQVSIDENLSDVQTVCFQAALLYTSSKGERRIRVHTLCLPVVSTLHDVINAANQQCIVGLLAKMAVDRSMQSSLSDAREAFINVAIDILSSYKLSLNLGSGMSGLLAPQCLKLLPLYICALLKYVAFRTGTSTRLDDRVKAMCDMKTLPLLQLIQHVYPSLFAVHNLDEQNTILNDDEEQIPQPPYLQLSARNINSNGAYLMDMGEHIILFVCSELSSKFLNNILNVPDFNSIPDQMYEIPLLGNMYSQKLHSFINYLNEEKPFTATLQVIKENSANRGVFLERLIEDRIENALSYHEFLQHLKTQVK